MKNTALILIAFGVFTLLSFKTIATKYVSKNAHISFFSHTVAEDITANNYKVVSTLNTETGEVVFSVPMQSFEFEKAQMQKHFNGKDFLDTQTFPKAKFTGTITNLSAVNFGKDGTYDATVKGELTIKGTTKPMNEKGTVTVKGNQIEVKTKLKVVLADYGVTFAKGKPSTNVAKEVEVTLNAVYQPEG
ncbi:MAG: Protein YceI [Saprospiraceae bacterium]|nr:Protein YceI [Saprospiraceae bacterium]